MFRSRCSTPSSSSSSSSELESKSSSLSLSSESGENTDVTKMASKRRQVAGKLQVVQFSKYDRKI